MKQEKLLKIGILVLLSLFLVSTSFAGGRWSKPDLPDIPDGWTEIDPAEEYPGFEYNGLTPACSNCPTCDSDKFTFFVKRGSVNKLVIYFQGGGGCWDPVNCLIAPTYTQQQDETIEMFADTEGMGIFDTDNPANPFRKWYFVYIPYCTGDIHWGASDTEYEVPDIFKEDFPLESWTIQHRGFVNFQVVLNWIKDSFERPRKIFVTGISAGSYGAIGAFPFIKREFPLSRAYVLGDAGNGIVSDEFKSNYIYNWNIQLPDWIPAYKDGYTPDMSPSDMYTEYANYYFLSKFAQYTTAYDETQAWFYNLMLSDESYIPYSYQPWLWGYLPYEEVWCDWNDQMIGFAYDTASSARNYRYYIAAGTDHTVLMSPKFYTEDSAGISLVKWVKAMVRNPFGMWGGRLQGRWKNMECEDCVAPVTCFP